MALVQNLAGVIIWTEDFERLVAFYRETLGLEPHSVRPNFVAFRFGDVRLSLGKHDKVAGPTREPYRIMVNLGVADIHQTYQRLKEAGVPFISQNGRDCRFRPSRFFPYPGSPASQ